MKMKNNRIHFNLPKVLVDQIMSLKTRKSKNNKKFHLVHIIIKLIKRKNLTFHDYIPIPSTYWKKAFLENYNRYMNDLIDRNIIQRNNSYSNFNGFKYCKTYRINPNLMTDWGNLVELTYLKEQIIKNRKENVGGKLKKETLKSLELITVDKQSADRLIKDYIENERFRKYIEINNEIDDSQIVNVNDLEPNSDPNEKNIFYPVKMILSVLKESERDIDLIKDKNTFRLTNITDYITQKKMLLSLSYNNSITSLINKEFFIKKGQTDKRLHTNITSFPKELLPALKFNGEEICSIDLKNSHSTILARMIKNGYFDDYIFDTKIPGKLIPIKKSITTFIERNVILNKFTSTIQGIKTNKGITRQFNYNDLVNREFRVLTQDLVEFIDLACEGKFYDEIKDILELDSRDSAKAVAFLIFYSSYRYNPKSKVKMKEIFPNLINLIDSYKRSKGSPAFAISLMHKESEIYIDKILPKLIKEGFHVLSKHDSILCPLSEKDRVREEMEKILNAELVHYQLSEEIYDGCDKENDKNQYSHSA